MIQSKTKRISPENSPETSELFFVLLKQRSNFSGEVILPETSPETSEQIFCTNVASEQKKTNEVLW
jgi:hypothetical protein